MSQAKPERKTLSATGTYPRETHWVVVRPDGAGQSQLVDPPEVGGLRLKRAFNLAGQTYPKQFQSAGQIRAKILESDSPHVSRANFAVVSEQAAFSADPRHPVELPLFSRRNDQPPIVDGAFRFVVNETSGPPDGDHEFLRMPRRPFVLHVLGPEIDKHRLRPPGVDHDCTGVVWTSNEKIRTSESIAGEFEPYDLTVAVGHNPSGLADEPSIEIGTGTKAEAVKVSELPGRVLVAAVCKSAWHGTKFRVLTNTTRRAAVLLLDDHVNLKVLERFAKDYADLLLQALAGARTDVSPTMGLEGLLTKMFATTTNSEVHPVMLSNYAEFQSSRPSTFARSLYSCRPKVSEKKTIAVLRIAPRLDPALFVEGLEADGFKPRAARGDPKDAVGGILEKWPAAQRGVVLQLPELEDEEASAGRIVELLSSIRAAQKPRSPGPQHWLLLQVSEAASDRAKQQLHERLAKVDKNVTVEQVTLTPLGNLDWQRLGEPDMPGAADQALGRLLREYRTWIEATTGSAFDERTGYIRPLLNNIERLYDRLHKDPE